MTIDIDFDVYKAITALRDSESVTPNDVLRDVFKLPRATTPPRQSSPNSGPAGGAADWVPKGVRFPTGTEFRARYKGQTYLAKVEGGALVRDGRRFDSPSAAAASVTNGFVNGWKFWECKLPGESTWRVIASLRQG